MRRIRLRLLLLVLGIRKLKYFYLQGDFAPEPPPPNFGLLFRVRRTVCPLHIFDVAMSRFLIRPSVKKREYSF